MPNELFSHVQKTFTTAATVSLNDGKWFICPIEEKGRPPVKSKDWMKMMGVLWGS